jgi:hypothetical protein
MKMVKLLVPLVLAVLLVGCEPQSEENKAIESIRSALSDVNKATDNGVSLKDYSEAVNRVGATMLIARPKIDMDKRKKDVMPLVLAATEYTLVQLLWTESIMNDVFRNNDVVIIKGELLPDGINKIELRKTSRETSMKAFGKEDTLLQSGDAYILPRGVAFSIYWVHAEFLINYKAK